MIKAFLIATLCVIASLSYAAPLSSIDVFLLPGQAAEETQGVAVNACTVVNLQQAQTDLQARIDSLSRTQAIQVIQTQSQALSTQVQCVAYAKALKVQRFPAIVFDQKFVVYGMTNIAVALQLYQDKVRATA